MDTRVEQIVEGLKRLLKGVATSFLATVEKDNGDTVDVKDLDGTRYPEVRKIATAGKRGILVEPVVGSYVIVSRIAGSNELFVSMYSEIETVEIKNDEYSLKQAFDEILDAIGRLTVTTATGPSGVPINKIEFDDIKQKVGKILK
jgi:uncharacterized linocin/CFP29 family protein